jgi:hypothetical protein
MLTTNMQVIGRREAAKIAEAARSVVVIGYSYEQGRRFAEELARYKKAGPPLSVVGIGDVRDKLMGLHGPTALLLPDWYARADASRLHAELSLRRATCYQVFNP